MASHAGVLRALDEVGGIDPNEARLVIGTSAGSVIGALVRVGRSTSEIWAVATRTVSDDDPTADLARADLFRRSWGTPSQLARRSLGSLYVMSRSLLRVPFTPIPSVARRVFPGGFMSVSEEEVDVGTGIPDTWPDEPLWLCTVNLDTGRRVVLGRRGDQPPLAHAVLASCAIPGYYQPVRLDGRTLVDGGVHSTTNLDLATRAEPGFVIAVAPMGHDPRRAPGPIGRATRRPINRGLARQRMTVRASGREVLLIRPGREELVAHGLNPMRLTHLEPVAVAAYDATARLLGRPEIRRRLDAMLQGAPRVANAS
jgi:NTE family protein